MGLFSVERSGDTQREETRRGEFGYDIQREPPLALDPLREGAQAGYQGMCRMERVGRGGGGRAHSPSRRWSSGMTSLAKRRALRSASSAGMPA